MFQFVAVLSAMGGVKQAAKQITEGCWYSISLFILGYTKITSNNN
jgi:hypothetical protein